MCLQAEHDAKAKRGRQQATKKPAVTPALRSTAEQGEGGAGGAESQQRERNAKAGKVMPVAELKQPQQQYFECKPSGRQGEQRRQMQPRGSVGDGRHPPVNVHASRGRSAPVSSYG